MKYDTKTTKAIYRTALLLAASMLAACGGGDDEAASSCKNPLLLIPCILDGQIPTSVDATTAAGTDSSTTAISGVVSTEGTDAEVFRYPDRYMDERGERMWWTVMVLLDEVEKS